MTRARDIDAVRHWLEDSHADAELRASFERIATGAEALDELTDHLARKVGLGLATEPQP